MVNLIFSSCICMHLLVEIDTALFIPTATKTATEAADVETSAYTVNGSPTVIIAIIVTIVAIIVGYFVIRRNLRPR